MPEARTCVSFLAPHFNTTEQRPEFINPGCYGDDVARWLIAELRRRGVEVDPEPGAEDFGWYLTFRFEGTAVNIVLGLVEDEKDTGEWFAALERAGALAALFGRRRQVPQGALDMVHEILTSSDGVSAVRWHHEKDWQNGSERGASRPQAN